MAAGRLDDWWDPAWDAARWDPAWSADRSAGALAPVPVTGQPGGAALAADSAEPGILARLRASRDEVPSLDKVASQPSGRTGRR